MCNGTARGTVKVTGGALWSTAADDPNSWHFKCNIYSECNLTFYQMQTVLIQKNVWEKRDPLTTENRRDSHLDFKTWLTAYLWVFRLIFPGWSSTKSVMWKQTIYTISFIRSMKLRPTNIQFKLILILQFVKIFSL